MANQHSQTSGSTATTLIDETIRAFDQGQAASPQEGMRDELQTGAPNPSKLQQLLNQLADQTETLAQGTDGDLPSRLTTLSTALRNFAGQFSTAV